jgi:hypothetical protein
MSHFLLYVTKYMNEHSYDEVKLLVLAPYIQAKRTVQDSDAWKLNLTASYSEVYSQVAQVWIGILNQIEATL